MNQAITSFELTNAISLTHTLVLAPSIDRTSRFLWTLDIETNPHRPLLTAAHVSTHGVFKRDFSDAEASAVEKVIKSFWQPWGAYNPFKQIACPGANEKPSRRPTIDNLPDLFLGDGCSIADVPPRQWTEKIPERDPDNYRMWGDKLYALGRLEISLAACMSHDVAAKEVLHSLAKHILTEWPKVVDGEMAKRPPLCRIIVCSSTTTALPVSARQLTPAHTG